MGKPKFSRKKYETPSHPWQEDRIKEENELVKKYGLKNKKEIWKAQTKLKKYRSQARELLAKVSTGDIQSKKESDQLLMHLNRLNILPAKSTLDDVLALETETILSRRLQTLTYLKGLASTPTQARQLISHGHIAIGDKRVTVPGYMVVKEEENDIGYTTDSKLNDMMHPARPKADFKSAPIKRETKPKEEKTEIKPEQAKKETEAKEQPTEEKPKEDQPAEQEKKDEKEETNQPEPKKEEKAPEKEQPKEEKPAEEKEQNEKQKKDEKEGGN